jgi:hypothetical protein
MDGLDARFWDSNLQWVAEEPLLRLLDNLSFFVYSHPLRGALVHLIEV